MRLLLHRAGLFGLRRLVLGSRPVSYTQGQSPEPRIREYFYYIDHQGQVFPELNVLPPTVIRDTDCGRRRLANTSATPGNRASCIIQDSTFFRLLEQKSRPIGTQDLMWHWTNKNAQVGDLLKILNDLKLLRARDIILSWQLDSQVVPSRNDLHDDWPREPLPPGLPPYQDPVMSPSRDSVGLQAKKSSRQQTETLKTTDCLLKPLPPPFSPPASLLSSSAPGSDSGTSIGSSDSSHEDKPFKLFSQVSVRSSGGLVWSLREVVEGTKNFCQSQLIGEGGFGHVYKATMRNTEYAVKKLKKDSELEWSTVKQSFLTEVDKLSGIRHPNIIDLAGYCMEDEVYCLIYLFLPNGSLESRLHCRSSTKPLSWHQRLDILLGVARAIQFLHLSQPSLIHGDVKSSNILLDEQLTPKLGDFGLARFRFVPTNTGQRSTAMWTSMVRGTLAYLPEEYVKMGKLTLELDTYSFGVVLLENVSGQQAIQSGGCDKTKYLKDVVKEEETKDQEEVEELKQKDPSFKVSRDDKPLRTGARIYRKYLDPRAGQCPEKVGIELCQLACRCLETQKKRPKMIEVYEKLKNLHDLLRCNAGGDDVVVSQDAAIVSSCSLPLPVLEIAESIKDMRLKPQENTFRYTPGSLGYVAPRKTSMDLHSGLSSCRSKWTSASEGQLSTGPSQINCVYPPRVHCGHGGGPPTHSPVYIANWDTSFLEMHASGQELRTFPNGLNQPVESDESLSDTCLNLCSVNQQRPSPLTPDSGHGRSMSPGDCDRLALGRHSRRTSVDCLQYMKGSLPDKAQCCCHQAEEHEEAFYPSRAGPLESSGLVSLIQQNGRPREIILNPAKEKIVQQFALYEQGTIDSMELLYSGPNQGLPSFPRGIRTPEESDDYT